MTVIRCFLRGSSIKRSLSFNLDLTYSFPQAFRSCVLLKNSRPFCTKSETNVKEVCNVGTIGHVDHGKTTLTAAITKYLSTKDKSCKYISYEEIDKAPEEKARGITINIAHVGYTTALRRYAHTDCPGHRDFIKNMITGTSQIESGILVVAADDGPMPQTKEHLMLAKQIGVKQIVVYINKADLADKDILDLVEIECRELLTHYGFNGWESPIIWGSALLALKGDTSQYGLPSLEKLLNAMDNYIKVPERDYNAPFLLPVDNVFTVPGRGTVVVGTIKEGSIKKNLSCDLLGFNEKLSTSISDIQIFQKSVPVARAGENVGVLLRNIKVSQVRRGMLLCAVNSQQLSNHFEAQVYLLRSDEGGRLKPIRKSAYCAMLYCSTWSAYCRFDVLSKDEIMMPGDHATVKLTMITCMPLLLGQTFTVRENKSTVATGRITKIFKDIPVNARNMSNIVIPTEEILLSETVIDKKIENV